MKNAELNSILREMVKILIEDGYKKKTLCAILLGSQSGPVFHGFMKGSNMLRPLERLVDGLGYDLHMVPIKKDDYEMSNKLDGLTEEFVDETRRRIINYVENKPVPQRKLSNRSIGLFKDVVDELYKELNLESETKLE